MTNFVLGLLTSKLHCNAVAKKKLKQDVLLLGRLALLAYLSVLLQQQAPRGQTPLTLRLLDRHASLLLGPNQHGEKDKLRRRQKVGLAARHRRQIQQLLHLTSPHQKPSYQELLDMYHQLSALTALPADELKRNPLLPSEKTVLVETHRPDGVQVPDETKADVVTPLLIDHRLALRNCVVVETSRPQTDPNPMGPARQRGGLLASTFRCT